MNLIFIPNSPDTSDTLIRRAVAAEPEAWRQLVDVYGPLLFRWSRRKGIQESDACDLVQEIFATIHHGLRRFERRSVVGSFRAWLRTIFNSRLTDWHRRNSRRVSATSLSEIDDLADRYADDSRADDETEMERCIEKTLVARMVLKSIQSDFQPETWSAFWLVSIDGRSPADVAEELGISIWSVYQAKSRVLRKLRRELTDLGE